MFTGLIEEIGSIQAIEEQGDARRLQIACTRVVEQTAVGDSIAVSGVCLTVTDLSDAGFCADVMQESLNRSSLGDRAVGESVNLERAVAVGQRLGGHTVQGHVDMTTPLLRRTPSAHWEVFRFALPREHAALVVEKGSIALDGVSLTISRVGPNFFEVSLIPTTLADTTLSKLAEGDRVNVEFDVIGKYVQRILALGDGGRHASAPGGD